MGFAAFGNDLYSGRRSIRFIERRRLWYIIAASMSLLSVVALVGLGLNPGIEFRGGSEYRLLHVADNNTTLGVDAVTPVLPGTQANATKVGDGIRVQTEKLTEVQSEQITTA